jgi:hypothetical protein
MSGLEFANPWLLAGLAAVGLPVLIHFLTRARPRRIEFPPYRFLVESCAGRQSLHRLRTIILLTLRTLAVLALVLLFTRPFLQPKAAVAGNDNARRAVLVIDASASMRAAQRGVTLFARAQSEAAAVLRTLDSGSEAAVILAGAQPRPLLPALSRNLPALHDALVKAAPTFEADDAQAAINLAAQTLGGQGTLYLFSDFQKSNWEAVRELPGGVAVRLCPMAEPPVDNVAVTALRVVPAEPVVGESAEAVCTVFNSSARPREETVRLELGALAQETRLAVPPFGAATALFTLNFPRAGVFTGKVSLAPDDLPEDNARYLAARVHKTLQLLLLSDAPTNDHRSAAFFAASALAPSPEVAPGFTLVRRHSQDADRGILETADVFLLAPPAQPSGETLDIITRRVREGAGLIVFLDGPTAPALLPPALLPPFRLLRTVTSPEAEALSAGPRRLFAEGDPGDWGELRVRRHCQNEILNGREGDVVLRHADGSAALTLSEAERGALACLNLPLSPEAGNLAGHPLFPSLLHELLREMRRGAPSAGTTPGQAWTLDAPVSGPEPVTVTGPDGQPVEAQPVSSGRVVRLALAAAQQPGVYEARQGQALVAAGVVNLDPRESDTRPLALANLKPGAGSSVAVMRGESELASEVHTRPLWPLLAAVAAALFALEMAVLAVWRKPGGSR